METFDCVKRKGNYLFKGNIPNVLNNLIIQSGFLYELCSKMNTQGMVTLLNTYARNFNWMEQPMADANDFSRIFKCICNENIDADEQWSTAKVIEYLFLLGLSSPLSTFVSRSPIILGRTSETPQHCIVETILYVEAFSFPKPKFCWSYRNITSDATSDSAKGIWESHNQLVEVEEKHFPKERTDNYFFSYISFLPKKKNRIFRCIITHADQDDPDHVDTQIKCKFRMNYYPMPHDDLKPEIASANPISDVGSLDYLDYPVSRKIALFIGASQYTEYKCLRGPDQDAFFLARVLRGMKPHPFEVISLMNLSKAQIMKALHKFAKELESENVLGVLVMSGHGCYSSQMPYFVPYDTPYSLRLDTDMVISTKEVLSILSKTKLGCVAFFDFCMTVQEIDQFDLARSSDASSSINKTMQQNFAEAIASNRVNVFPVFAAAPWKPAHEHPPSPKEKREKKGLNEGERRMTSQLTKIIVDSLKTKATLPLEALFKTLTNYTRLPTEPIWMPVSPVDLRFRDSDFAKVSLGAHIESNRKIQDTWKDLAREKYLPLKTTFVGCFDVIRSCHNSFRYEFKNEWFFKVCEIKEALQGSHYEIRNEWQPGCAKFLYIHNVLHESSGEMNGSQKKFHIYSQLEPDDRLLATFEYPPNLCNFLS